VSGAARVSRLGVAAALVVLGVAAGHVGALPATLEDIDSVNFALGVRDFDPAQHRPHPPGYPLYIALGKVATAATSALWPDGRADRVEARALAAVSLLGALLLCWWTSRAFSALASDGDDRIGPPPISRRGLLATVLAATTPLTWYLTSRPMSDVPGLAAAMAALVCLSLAWWRQRPAPDGDRRLEPAAMAASGRAIVLGALLAGLSVGFRSQTLWITAPLLLLLLTDRIGRGVAGAMLGSSVAFAAGVLAWGVPLLVASGGVEAYLAALGSQAGEDFAGVEMLYLNPTPRLAAFTLLRTFVWPWDSVPLASVVLLLAAIGALLLLVRERRTLAAIAAIAAPYLAFHLAFQDTTFARYALPVVWPVAFLAAVALDTAGRAGAVAGVAIAAWSLSVAVPQLSAYVAGGSPTARLFDRVTAAAATSSPTPIVAMHQALLRPLEAEPRPIGARLPSPPRREWLELARHWQSGAVGPVWFLADPRRTDLALVDPQARLDVERFDWGLTSLSLVGGMRPADVQWYRLGDPGWFATEGWSLTPETAGMARLMGRGPHLGPIHAFVRRRAEPARVLVGGRHLGAEGDPAAIFTVGLGGRVLDTWPQPAGFFVRAIDVPAGALGGDGRFADLTIVSAPASGTEPVPTAIEQFDVQSAGVTMWAFGRGFHELELDNQRALAWRWMSEEAVLEVPQVAGDVTLVLEGESPLTYFDVPSTLEVWSGEARLARVELAADFTVRLGVLASRLQAGGGTLRLTTSQTFAPAERGGSADRRRLGLRLFTVALQAGLPAR
jgi:hypothetical protein